MMTPEREVEIRRRLEDWRTHCGADTGDHDFVLIFEAHAADDVGWLLAELDRVRAERDLAYQSAHLSETREFGEAFNRAGAEALLRTAGKDSMSNSPTDLPARLRALIELWREAAATYPDHGYGAGAAHALHRCADQLADLAAALQGSETAPEWKPGNTVTACGLRVSELHAALAEDEKAPRHRPFRELREQMSPEAQVRADGRTAELSAELEKAADAPAPAPHGWQPIETAPKDTRVLASFPRYGVLCAVLISRTGTWVGQALERVGEPTHWQPLPPPPTPDREEER